MIRQRAKGVFSIRVYAGLDPLTGKERHAHRTLRGTKTEARQLERKLSVEVAAGKHRTPNVTFGQLLDAWLEHTAPDLSPTTLYTYRRYADRILRPALGSLRLSQLTTARLDALYARLRASGGHTGQPLSPATIRQVHAIARRALRQAQRWGWIDKNPAELATLPPARQASLSIPSPAQVGSLVDAAREEDLALGLAVWLAAVTGVRRGELCGLRFTDVDVDGRSILVGRSVVAPRRCPLTVKDTKTHRSRLVAIDDLTVSLLREQRTRLLERALAFGASLHPDAYVLSESPDGSEPLHPDRISKRFLAITRQVGIACRLHDLRHFSVTTALAAGIPVRQVADRHGHASATMTLDVYGHAIADLDRQAAESVASALQG